MIENLKNKTSSVHNWAPSLKGAPVQNHIKIFHSQYYK